MTVHDIVTVALIVSEIIAFWKFSSKCESMSQSRSKLLWCNISIRPTNLPNMKSIS